MTGAFILLAMVAFTLLACLLALLIDLKSKREELKDADQAISDWMRRYDTRFNDYSDKCRELHELHAALYLSDRDAHQATHQQAVERAKALASGWYVKAVDHFVDQLWKVFGDNRKAKTFENMRAALDEFVAMKEAGTAVNVQECLNRVSAEYRELRDAINSVSPGDENHDNHLMLLGRIKAFFSHSETVIESMNKKIIDLGRDSASWRALRREIADYCGKPVPEDSEPPNHGDCVEMLRRLQTDAKDARWKAKGFDLVHKVVTGRDIDFPEFPPISPAMGVSLKAAESLALIPTADSIEIEKAISHPDKMQFHRENIRRCDSVSKSVCVDGGTFRPLTKSERNRRDG